MVPLVTLLLDGALLLLQYNYCYKTVSKKIKGKELIDELNQCMREEMR